MIRPPTSQPEAQPSPLAHAGFGRRVGAYLIDYAIVIALGLVPAVIVVIVAYWLLLPDYYTQAEEDAATDTAVGYATFVYAAVSFLYYWLANALGGTLGKRILGLRVVRASDGNNLGVGPGFGRVIVWFIGGIPLGLGWWWASWDKRGQAWHDKAVDSIVVKKAG